MVNLINMDNTEKIQNIISDYKNKSNTDLKYVMDYLSNDFEDTKSLLIRLTHHLDNTEKIYNEIHNEYKKRTKQ
jgi:sulfite reductase alpha subunit-like flavoprotein